MKICLLTSSFPRFEGDFPGIFVYQLGLHLLDLGIEVVALVPHEHPLPHRENLKGIEVYRYPYFFPKAYQRLCYGAGIRSNIKKYEIAFFQFPLYFIAQFFALIWARKSLKIDIVNSHWLVPQGFNAALLAKLTKLPHVCTVHAAGVQALRRSPLGRNIGAFISRYTDHFFTVSSFIDGQLKTLVDESVETTILPMGVDTSFFSMRAIDLEARKQLRLGEGPLLLFIGRLVEKKGVQYLINALPEVIKKIPDVQTLILGDGDLLDDLKDLVTKHGLDEQVHFLGSVLNEQVPGYLAMCDWLIMPSIVGVSGQTEGMPVTLLEAFAIGRPVVASRVAGIPDVVADGENGFLTRPGDASDLASKIVQAVQDTDWQKFSEAARRTAERYDWTRIASQYADVFHAVLSEVAVKK